MAMIDKLPTIFGTQPYLIHLYRALLSTTYFGMFRIGEVTLGDNTVKAKDVHIADNKDKMMFVLHTLKTHWKNNRPQMIKIQRLDASGRQNSGIPNAEGILSFRSSPKIFRRSKIIQTHKQAFFCFQGSEPSEACSFQDGSIKNGKIIKSEV